VLKNGENIWHRKSFHFKVKLNAFDLKSNKWISITLTPVVLDCNSFDINGKNTNRVWKKR
jgi:hypothetical protein